MTTYDEIRSMLSESRKLAIEGNMDEATRLSGETLAEADALLRQKPATEIIALFAEAAEVHADALRCMGMTRESFSLCVMAISQLSLISAPDSAMADLMTLSLLCIAFACYLAMLEEMQPGGDDTADHVRTIGTYLLSMIYFMYSKCNDSVHFSASPAAAHIVRNAYDLIREYSSIIEVQSPMITVNGKDLPPENITDIFADLAGRALAIKMMTI